MRSRRSPLEHGKQFYVPSMSARLLCYKGMLLATQVGEYYLDLKDPRLESALALVHQRFSTNTFPSWDLAHPFRMICHKRRDQHGTRQRQLDPRRGRARFPARCSATISRRSGR